MRDGNERLLDILEAIEEMSDMRSGAGMRFFRTNWCRSGWCIISRSSGKQPPVSLMAFDAFLPAFPGNR